VPFTERVKISSTNVRLETILPQKEETFQVVIDLIKNSLCFKAFTISTDILEIFMQQFWYSNKKVQSTDSYESLLANKKCVVNADVFRTILDICPRVKGVNFINVPDDDTTLAFLIKLGYKGPLYKHANMFIDHRKEKKSRHENMSFPRFTKEYGLPIPETMLTKAIKQSECYLMFIKYSTGQIPPKKSRGKDILQALKESKTSKRQPGTGGSSEGTSTIPGVLDESTVVSATSKEGNGTKPGVPNKENDITEENVILEWGSEQESEYSEEDQLDDKEKDDKDDDVDDEANDHISDYKDTDDEAKSDEDEIYTYKICTCKDEDEEMLNAKVNDSDKCDKEVTDAAKADAEKTLEVKDATKKTKLPPTISSLSLRVAKLEKDVYELKNIDLSTEAFVALKTQVPSVVGNYLRSKFGDVFQKELKKHTEDLIQKYSLQQIIELPKKQTPTVDLEQESEKSPSEILKIKKEQAGKQNCQILLSKALIEDENSINKGVVETVQDHKRKHDDDDDDEDDDDEDDDDEDPLAGLNQGKKTKRRRTKESESSKNPSTTKETPKGKAPSKGSKTSKYALANELVEEPIIKVVMEDAGDDVVHDDDDQLQDDFEHKTAKTPNPKWFTQPLRPLTPVLEWNKRQARVLATLNYSTTSNALTNMLYLNNHEGDRYPFDMSKPLPLQCQPGHLTIAADYFFNNDLDYLKSFDVKRMYTTSITKTRAAQYEIEGIEDMVKRVSVKKLHGYGHLEEIRVKRADRFTTWCRELPEETQHHSTSIDLSRNKNQRTLPFVSQTFRVIYEDMTKQKRVMRADELYKFLDRTLKKVRVKLHHKIHDFHLEYNNKMPRRKWKTINRKRSELMVELIDKQMRERRIIGNLERLDDDSKQRMSHEADDYTGYDPSDVAFTEWKGWNMYTKYDDMYEINHEVDKSEELYEIHELAACNIRRFKMIKYSFGQDDEYVSVKEDEYDDLEKTSDDACREYQEIFCMIDEGWMPPIYYDDDDDDDKEYYIQVSEFYKNSPIAITPVIPTVEPKDSLSMRDEHLSTIPKKESDKEFVDELAPINPIPLGIVEADFDQEEDIRLIEKFNSLMEEIDIFFAPNDLIAPGIKNADYDSDGDVLFLEELLNEDSISLPEYESFHVDFYNVPSYPRPPEKPPDDDVYFDIELDTGVLTTKVVDDISDNSTRELYVHVPNVLPTLPPLYLVFETLLPFSFENKDKVFNLRILISKEEKSPHFLSHRGFKAFQLISDFSESPMMIYGETIPILDVLFLHFYPP
nr:hypothetical protein [Tanacetum cinerariifolium]